MLTIEEYQKRLGDKAKDLSDEEIIQFRDALHRLAETAIDRYFEKLDQAEIGD